MDHLNQMDTTALINEYLTLKESVDIESVQKSDLDKIFRFFEQKLLKIDSTTTEVSRENDEIDVNVVSRRLNKFLEDNIITYRVFDDEIFGLTKSACWRFCNAPEEWSKYTPEMQNRIKIVEEFLNNKQKRENFLKKCAMITRSGKITAQFVDTFELSTRVNQFLEENAISEKLLNREIVKISDVSFKHFLNNPRQFSRYYTSVQKSIIKLNNFMNDEQRVKRFVEKHGVASLPVDVNDEDEMHLRLDDSDDEASQSIDTAELSKCLNRFLKDNSIAIAGFNRDVAKMSHGSFYGFLKQPKEFSRYQPGIQHNILNIHNFLRNEREVQLFIKGKKSSASVDLSQSQHNEVESTIQPVNALQLSGQVNRFLKENSIAIRDFNRDVAKMSHGSFYDFLKKPRMFSGYIKVIQEKILNIQGFFGDEKRVKQFLEKSSKRIETGNQVNELDHATTTTGWLQSNNDSDNDSGSDYRVEFIKDENDLM